MSTIATLRELSGLSQTQLAKSAGVNPTHISNLESLKRGCSVRVLDRVLDALNATPSQRSAALSEVGKRATGDAARSAA